MFGLSFGELVIIGILALLLLGPDRLPDAAKTLAKGLKELRRASEDLKEQIGTELSVVDEAKRAVTDALTGALTDTVAAKADAPLPQRGPPPAAAPGNVPGLEAALVEPATGPAAHDQAAPPEGPAGGGGARP
jgi:sec-independent protein translocase protein TatB